MGFKKQICKLTNSTQLPFILMDITVTPTATPMAKT